MMFDVGVLFIDWDQVIMYTWFFNFNNGFWWKRQVVCVILHVIKHTSAEIRCYWGLDVQHWGAIY